MKKKSKIILCGIMTLIMAFVMAMPVSVSAVVNDDDVARIGDTGYATLSEAVADVEENGSGEIIILKNIENCSKIQINNGKNIKIDLNKYNIGFNKNQNFRVEGGTLSLTGTGKVYEEEPYYSPVMLYGSAEDVADYSVVNVGKNVTLEGWSGLFIDQNNTNDNYGIVANINGTLNSVKDTTGAGGHALYINGTIKATTGNVPQITLDGATLNTELGNGMYLAGYAETFINNSTINSTADGNTGIELRAGKLEINNSNIIGGKGATSIVSNGNGSTTGNVALAVVQHTTKLPTEVTVINSGFEGGAALFEQNAQNNDPEAVAKVKIDIQSGTFTGKIYSENKDKFIKAGTFSETVENDYIADEMISIKYESGQTVLYHIGTPEQINDIVKDAANGDKIEVLKGDIALSIAVSGVEVSNTGGGSVTVNDEEVTADNPVITTEPVQQPTTTPGNEQGTTGTEAAGDSAKTGDDFNMTAVIAIMGIAAAAAAGTIVYGRRKRSN